MNTSRRARFALVALGSLLIAWAPALLLPTSSAAASTRPFPAPVTSHTLAVPATVKTGSAFNAWLAEVPDGSIAEFPANATIDLDTGFDLNGRNNLVLRLNGATLRVRGPGDVPDSSPFFLRESSHIEIDGPATVLGNNPNTTTLFTSGKENSHVLALSGWGGQGPSSYIEIGGIDARNIYGDFAYLEGRNVAPNEPSSFVWVHDNTATWIGRNAVSYINVKDVLIEGNTFDKIGMDALDIEPNLAVEQARHCVFRHNKIGTYGYMTGFQGWFLNTWSPNSSPVSDITVDDNDVVGNPAGGYDGTARALHANVTHSQLSNIVFTNNRTAQPAPGPVLRFVNVQGLTVHGNVQPLTSGELTTFSEPAGPMRTLAYVIGLVVVLAAAGLLVRRYLRFRRSDRA